MEPLHFSLDAMAILTVFDAHDQAVRKVLYDRDDRVIRRVAFRSDERGLLERSPHTTLDTGEDRFSMVVRFELTHS